MRCWLLQVEYQISGLNSATLPTFPVGRILLYLIPLVHSLFHSFAPLLAPASLPFGNSSHYRSFSVASRGTQNMLLAKCWPERREVRKTAAGWPLGCGSHRFANAVAKFQFQLL